MSQNNSTQILDLDQIQYHITGQLPVEFSYVRTHPSPFKKQWKGIRRYIPEYIPLGNFSAHTLWEIGPRGGKLKKVCVSCNESLGRSQRSCNVCRFKICSSSKCIKYIVLRGTQEPTPYYVSNVQLVCKDCSGDHFNQLTGKPEPWVKNCE